jgi:hypothetical protein
MITEQCLSRNRLYRQEWSEVFASPSRGSRTRSRGDALIWSSNVVVRESGRRYAGHALGKKTADRHTSC